MLVCQQQYVSSVDGTGRVGWLGEVGGFLVVWIDLAAVTSASFFLVSLPSTRGVRPTQAPVTVTVVSSLSTLPLVPQEVDRADNIGLIARLLCLMFYIGREMGIKGGRNLGVAGRSCGFLWLG